MKASVSDADLAVALSYLDGELETAEQRAFELRLGREADLARAFEDLAEVDALARVALQGHRRSRPRWLHVAAILLASTALGIYWGTRERVATPHVGSVELAVVETAPSDVGLHELLGLDLNWLPAGMAFRGAGVEPPAADVYASALEEAFREHVQRSSRDSRVLSGLRSFVIGVRPVESVFALLIAVPDGGEAEVLFPQGQDQSTGRLQAGELIWLPAAPITLPGDWRQSQRIEYRPGVLVRRGVSVLLALRSTDPGEELSVELAQRLSGAAGGRDAGELESWLGQQGFVVERFEADR